MPVIDGRVFLENALNNLSIENHKEISNKEQNAVCICGYKCHRPLNESEKHDKQYKIMCTFGELGSIPDLNFSYQDVEQSNMNICLVCLNY